jgi:hypothetical protein
MSIIAQTITSVLKLAAQPSPLLARPPVREKETAAEVAADYARKHKMRKERDEAYWEMMFEQDQLLGTGMSTKEGFEKATIEWLRKYPAP